MNAPVSIDPAISAYAGIVTTFLPLCHGAELDLRARILMARESATIMLQTCADQAAPLYQEIVRLSILCAYAGMTEDELRRLVQCLRRLISAATIANEIFEDGPGGRG